MLNRIQPVATRDLMHTDDVMPWLLDWRRAGQRCALVTVVGIEGGSPRSAGAQMAVSETGAYVGYLSGGCLEQAVAHEALAVIMEGQNRLVRYGKNSRYFDIRLPCGAGLDIYFDQSLDQDVIAKISRARAERSITALRTDLVTGSSEAVDDLPAGMEVPSSGREGDTFTRVYVPAIRMHLVGIGPSMAAIARLASNVGIDVETASPDEGTQTELALCGLAPHNIACAALPPAFHTDPWTAAVLAFHEHHWEPPILQTLLDGPCFYIGAVGSRRVHEARLEALAAEGVDDRKLARIRGPIGMIAGAKGCASLAIGVVAEIMAEAKARNFIV
ncbi:MAG: XdhC family protein [Hyphomicrobium sp.]|uniref:XdhC family protein n=1 Tax=Hyphomicrobium sp. TaxID=82 RepID=UPI003D1502A3